MHYQHHQVSNCGPSSTAQLARTNASNTEENSLAQYQVNAEIQRFESVHPRIYLIYELINKIANSELELRERSDLEQIREQVINIEDAFVNSQEWTLSRFVNEIRLGVIGPEDSCKNALVHYFLTRNWNWDDAPEGGRFKKEIIIDGRSYLLLIRDEGLRAPNEQFAHWIDALLVVFTIGSRQSFQSALELYKKMHAYRTLDSGELPIYLIGMKNMSNMGQRRAVEEEEAHNISKMHKMSNYFECADGSSVQRMFSAVCQRIVQQRTNTRASSFIGRSEFASGVGNIATASSGRPPGYSLHQRSISVLPVNNEDSHSSHTNRFSGLQPNQTQNHHNKHNYFQPPSNMRNHQNYASFTPNTNMVGDRRRESADHSWTRSTPFQFAMPSTPSCSALISAATYDQTASIAISPTYSHNTISSNYHKYGKGDNGMTSTAAAPYARSTSNIVPSSQQRPNSDPNHPQYIQNELFYDPGQLLPHPLSTATSSSTLVLNANSVGSNANLSTPGTTPNTQRKNRRISNIFRKEHLPTPEERAARSSAEINLGIGRAIPVKQGQLYKRAKNGLNKEWKKKYVCLYSDGRICYHQNLKDYMDKDSRGKEIYLGLATVRTSDRHRQKANNKGNALHSTQQQGSGGKENQQRQNQHEKSIEPSINEEYPVSPMGELSEGISDGVEGGGVAGLVTSTSSSVLIGSGEKEKGKKEKSKEKKKRAKRIGSGLKNEEEEECCEFEIVSCDQKRWEFSAASVDERDKWVLCIEKEIEKCLQQQLSLKDMQSGVQNGQDNRGSVCASEKVRANIQSIRLIKGNDKCADCSTPNPNWASINLGTLICIECSGIHRKLGSHISKVRSLELDDWPLEHLVVMNAIGNSMANSIWEHNAPPKERPGPDAPRDRKEQWIRMIYERKLYLPHIPVNRTLNQQLVESVLERNIKQLLTVLPRCTKEHVNAPICSSSDKRTAVHLACAIGAPEILQLLIWYNADIKSLDEKGRNCLWHAQMNGSNECAAILLQAGLSPIEEPKGGSE